MTFLHFGHWKHCVCVAGGAAEDDARAVAAAGADVGSNANWQPKHAADSGLWSGKAFSSVKMGTGNR